MDIEEIRVKSLPLKDVLKDLADAMDTPLTEDCDVYILKIPFTFGKGHIFGINFPSGLGLICYHVEFNCDLTISFTVDSVHPAKFLYVVDGELEHNFEHSDETHYLSQYQSAIVASNDYNGHVLRFKKGITSRMFSLEIDREKFSSSQNCSIEKMDNPIKNLLLDTNASQVFYHEGGYNLELFELLRKITITSFLGMSRQFFLLSAAAGILHQQLLQYELDVSKPKAGNLKNEEIELVQKAITIIVEDMRDPVNIDFLAKTIGSNSARLQYCFKLVYGTTVNGYIKNARVQKAAELLIYSDLSVSEIIAEVGLINRGYFSKIFKAHYGITAKAFRSRYEKR